jgi:hypothetical protein
MRHRPLAIINRTGRMRFCLNNQSRGGQKLVFLKQIIDCIRLGKRLKNGLQDRTWVEKLNKSLVQHRAEILNDQHQEARIANDDIKQTW